MTRLTISRYQLGLQIGTAQGVAMMRRDHHRYMTGLIGQDEPSPPEAFLRVMRQTVSLLGQMRDSASPATNLIIQRLLPKINRLNIAITSHDMRTAVALVESIRGDLRLLQNHAASMVRAGVMTVEAKRVFDDVMADASWAAFRSPMDLADGLSPWAKIGAVLIALVAIAFILMKVI